MSTPTKIIIIDGNEFQVAADTDNEAIRAQLAQSFPMAQSATIQTGTRTLDGVEYQTVEFVKKVGTKGNNGAAIRAALASVSAQWDAHATLPTQIRALLAGELLISACCDPHLAHLLDAVIVDAHNPSRRHAHGGFVCVRSLASLPAVADASRAVW